MKQELKNKFEAILEDICPNRPWQQGGKTDAMILKCEEAAYTLAKSEDAERIKELEGKLVQMRDCCNTPWGTDTERLEAINKILNPKP